MVCGPALAGLLQGIFKVYKITLNKETLPGWIMAVEWLMYLVRLWISFRELVQHIEEINISQKSNSVPNNNVLEEGPAQPLLIKSEGQDEGDGDQECDESEEAREESRLPTTSISVAYRLLTPSVKTLYMIGARKVVVFWVGIIGCIPEEMDKYGTNRSCIDLINSTAVMFNNGMKPLIDKLNNNVPDAKFIYINMTSIGLGDTSLIGITNINEACCKVSKTKAEGQCEAGEEPCSNREAYVFFDNLHPTEIANLATAT